MSGNSKNLCCYWYCVTDLYSPPQDLCKEAQGRRNRREGVSKQCGIVQGHCRRTQTPCRPVSHPCIYASEPFGHVPWSFSSVRIRWEAVKILHSAVQMTASNSSYASLDEPALSARKRRLWRWQSQQFVTEIWGATNHIFIFWRFCPHDEGVRNHAAHETFSEFEWVLQRSFTKEKLKHKYSGTAIW